MGIFGFHEKVSPLAAGRAPEGNPHIHTASVSLIYHLPSTIK